MDDHERPGHADVTLSLSGPTRDGRVLFRSWTICECSPLLARLDPLLGPPEHESLHTEDTMRQVAEKVLEIPGGIHLSEGAMTAKAEPTAAAGQWLDGYQAVGQAPVEFIHGSRSRRIDGHLITGSWSDP